MFSAPGFAHEDESSADSIADSFVISQKGLDKANVETNRRIRLLISRLKKLNEVAPSVDRNYGFFVNGELTTPQKNAAADILIEALKISLDHAEQSVSCQACDPQLPLRYSQVIKLKIHEIRNVLQTAQGGSFERFETVVNYMIIKFQINREEFFKNMAQFFKGVGIKVGGDLAEIYGERGSVALAVVFLTWIPYTFVSEAIEHSIIGPLAVFCMTSQFLYFAAMKSLFDTLANMKNVVMYRMSSKSAIEMMGDISKLLSFELKLRYSFGSAISQEFPKTFSRSKLKRALHIDGLSRLTNIFTGFRNFFVRQLYKLGLTSQYREADLYQIRIDSFLYGILKTHNWADIANIESNHNMDIDLSQNREEARHLETQLNTLIQEGRRFEAYIVLKEMYLLLDILRKQMATSLRIMKQNNSVSMGDYNTLKISLGVIYNRAQKLKFAAYVDSVSKGATAQDVRRIFESYLGLVEILKFHYVESSKMSQGEALDLIKFSADIKTQSKSLYKKGFGFLGSCERYFSFR